MESFAELKKLFEWDLYKMLDEVFKQSEVQDTMIDFNQDQLQDGTDALGQTIVTIGGSPYRQKTVIAKRKKGQPTNKVTLYDTGEFYKTFKVQFVNQGYEITADFEKEDGSIYDNFTSQYDFMGLDTESLTELVMEVVLPRLGTMIRKKIGL